MNTPNPGSTEALDKGCICPVLDNVHGRGIEIDGKTYFCIDHDCPLHGHNADKNGNDK